MSGRFEGAAQVDRPIEQAFDFLADGENDLKFSPRIVEIAENSDGPPGVGTIYESTARPEADAFAERTRMPSRHRDAATPPRRSIPGRPSAA